MEKNTLQNSLNELSKGTTKDVDSIMIRDAAGNQYWIAKADLASVLGGLIASNIDTCIKILNKGLIKGIINNNDLNDLTNIGYYFIHTGNTNAPTSSAWYFMEVYNFSSIYIIQRATVWNNPLKVYQRTRTDSGWSEWVQL